MSDEEGEPNAGSRGSVETADGVKRERKSTSAVEG